MFVFVSVDELCNVRVSLGGKIPQAKHLLFTLISCFETAAKLICDSVFLGGGFK